MTPMLRHCIDCDKPATIIHDDIFYCASCALEEIEKKKEEKKDG